MQLAISTHRMARNFPCWNRYFLHVSQMVCETSAMDSCTGSVLVCQYCTSPKIAPTAHMTMPRYISVRPPKPPSPSNFTCSRPGIFRSASPACRPPVEAQRAAAMRPREREVFMCIKFSLSRNGYFGCNLSAVPISLRLAETIAAKWKTRCGMPLFYHKRFLIYNAIRSLTLM